MKILITGFTPFGGETINPAYEAVKLLPDTIGEATIIKAQIETAFAESIESVRQLLSEHRPDVVINIGQYGGSASLTIEKVAVNIAASAIPDNKGYHPKGEPLCPGGREAYFATIPVDDMVAAVKSHGYPCHISYSAGAYVCNNVMYNTLKLADELYPGMRAGFIHVPYAPQQVVDKPCGTPFMSIEDISKCLLWAISVLAKEG